MYLSPLSVKTKHARVGSFTTYLGCPERSQNIEEEPSNRLISGGRRTVDVRGVEPLSKQIISYTLYILVNVPMISRNIRFKPFQVRSKTFLRHSWLITPLGDILCLRALKTWLKIYRNPHDTKILRGLYSAFLIYFAGFN